MNIPDKHQLRLLRRIDRKDNKIAALEKKIQKLEAALSWRTVDLESLTRNVHDAVQRAMCNVRMIPVNGGIKTSRIMEVRDIPADS
jgi:hypothetical protein